MTMDLRSDFQDAGDEQDALGRRHVRDIGARIGFFVQWADSIDSERSNLEKRRSEYRELLAR